MKNKLVLALAAVVLMAAPAFAAVQNVKVSGDIDSTYINRQHFNFGQKVAQNLPVGGTETGLKDQSAFLTQTRVRIDADLSDNVSTTVGLINERGWGAEGSSDTDVQLYLAYATLREFLYSPLTVSVGRQVFAYGNGLILGDGGVNNAASGGYNNTIANDLTKRTAYDGIKAILDYKPLTVDLIYFKNGSSLRGSHNAYKSQSDVYGLNANYQLGDAMNTVVEGYFFSRVGGDNNTSVVTNDGDTLYVPGLRVSTNPIKGLNTQAEVAWQAGSKAVTPNDTAGGASTPGGENFRRSAMAAQVMANYSLPIYEQYKPTVGVSYTYVSGDDNADVARDTGAGRQPRSGETYSAWDAFNEAQASGTIYNSLFNLTNMSIASANVSVSPIQDVTAQVVWSGLYLNKKLSGTNTLANMRPTTQPDGSTVGTLATTSSHFLGNEYDVNLNYAYTEDVTLGVSLGWFVPGSTFTNANDSVASQALAHVLVNF